MACTSIPWSPAAHPCSSSSTAREGFQSGTRSAGHDPKSAAACPVLLAHPHHTRRYMTARLISDANLQLLRRYDKRPPELQASLLDESGPAYVDAFLTVLRNVTKEETVQYILALLLQMLQDNPSRAQLFHQLPASTDPYAIFLRLLQRSDWFTQDKACRLLVAVIQSRPHKGAFTHVASSSSSQAGAAAAGSSSGPADPAEQHISSFVDWLCGQLRRYPVSGGAAARVPVQVSVDPLNHRPCLSAALSPLLAVRFATIAVCSQHSMKHLAQPVALCALCRCRQPCTGWQYCCGRSLCAPSSHPLGALVCWLRCWPHARAPPTASSRTKSACASGS